MSKKTARSKQSYLNEELAVSLVPAILQGCGFTCIKTSKHGQVKFVDATAALGERVRFWLKLGWTGSQPFCAIQFGLFGGEMGQDIPDAKFLEFVERRVESVKAEGATHALFIQMADGLIADWVALKIDDVAMAYRTQLEKWPDRARNTKSATLWFADKRSVKGAECVHAVLDLQLDLHMLAQTPSLEPDATEQKAKSGVQKVTVEIERRMRQAAFRLALGRHYGWACAVTGTNLRETLDAAHLPGRNWRYDNEVTDGVLLRADLHRLLDAGLARLERGRFFLEEEARGGDYVHLHGVLLGSAHGLGLCERSAVSVEHTQTVRPSALVSRRLTE